MTEDQFWEIIGRTTKYQADTRKQSEALKTELRALSAEEIQHFETTFDTVMKRSYTWDLWGADYVVHGGASDDAFEYFRCWLISKGRGVFERVSADPDSLADLLAPDSQGALEYEDFAYVARDVWGEKAGRPSGEMPNASAMIHSDEPSGEPFDEDEAALAARYPKLWNRFGENPLT
jgi:Protein of unknown function (DUF4240)